MADYDNCVIRETKRLRMAGIKSFLCLVGVLAGSFVLPLVAYLIMGPMYDGIGQSLGSITILIYWGAEMVAVAILSIPAAIIRNWLDYTRREAEEICKKHEQEKAKAQANAPGQP